MSGGEAQSCRDFVLTWGNAGDVVKDIINVGVLYCRMVQLRSSGNHTGKCPTVMG